MQARPLENNISRAITFCPPVQETPRSNQCSYPWEAKRRERKGWINAGKICPVSQTAAGALNQPNSISCQKKFVQSESIFINSGFAIQSQPIDQAHFYSSNELEWSAGTGPEQGLTWANLPICFGILCCLCSTTWVKFCYFLEATDELEINQQVLGFFFHSVKELWRCNHH